MDSHWLCLNHLKVIHHMVSAKAVHESRDPRTNLCTSSHHCSLHEVSNINSNNSLILNIWPSMLCTFTLE